MPADMTGPGSKYAVTALALLFCLTSPAQGQEEPLLDDPELLRDLSSFAATATTPGQRLPIAPLSCAFVRNAVVNHVVRAQDGSPELLLVSFPTNFAGYKLFPNIVHRRSDGAWVRSVVPQTFDGFRHLTVSSNGRNWLLLMDNVPEARGWETRTVLSNDGGLSWHYGEDLRKYIYFDTIRYLRMSDAGSGTAVEHYPGGVDGYDQAGYYLFDTDDWGETWSERRYEPVVVTSGYVDAYPVVQQMDASEVPLGLVQLPGLHACNAPE